MNDPVLKEKLQKFREEHNAKDEEDKKKAFLDRRKKVLMCLEKAMV